MTNTKATVGALVLLAVAAVAGAGSALFTYEFLAEYGPTSGSRAAGALSGLSAAAAPLLVTGALVVAALVLGRRSGWVRGLAVAVVLLGAGGAMVAGAQAAITKYDRLPRLPDCGAEMYAGSPAPHALQEAFSELEHPWPFGAFTNSIDACGSNLLNATFDEAAAHYRQALSAAGWEITRDDATRLTARRNDLEFVLADRCGSLGITIKLVEAEGFRDVC